MQFITDTWQRWSRDGNGDGFEEVQNLYDAAAGAAAYLCASGPIRSDDDLRRAYFSYNHSQAYVETVLQRAHGYREALVLPEPEPEADPGG
jgi:membrane-bound lytic murein transglycosylase B